MMTMKRRGKMETTYPQVRKYDSHDLLFAEPIFSTSCCEIFPLWVWCHQQKL